MFRQKELSPVQYILRIIGGGYLVYLAWSLLSAAQEAVGTGMFFLWLAAILVFSGVGAILAVTSVLALVRQKKAEGDIQEDSTEEQESKDNE